MAEFLVDPGCGAMEVRETFTNVCVACSLVCSYSSKWCALCCQEYTKELTEKENVDVHFRQKENGGVDRNLLIAILCILLAVTLTGILGGILYFFMCKRNPLQLQDPNAAEPLINLQTSPPDSIVFFPTAATDVDSSGTEPQSTASEENSTEGIIQLAPSEQTNREGRHRVAPSGQVHQEGRHQSLQGRQSPWHVTNERRNRTMDTEEDIPMELFSHKIEATDQGECHTPIDIPLTEGLGIEG